VTSATGLPAVILRPPDEHDVDWITEACQDAEIQRWTRVPAPYTRADAEAFVAGGSRSLETLVIIDVFTDEGLGATGIHRIDPTTGVADSGYWVAPWARGRGVATAALLQVVERACKLGATAVQLLISPGNIGSIRVAERAGFTLVERRADACFDGAVATDALVYRRELLTPG
jgi:RimJ/RimL family protein N-acetyltransferase